MEPRFGRDFSQVRIHSGNRAADLARSINARAFTVGRDVVFGEGQYTPASRSGKFLLAHELTHVVQQTSAGKRNSSSRKTSKENQVVRGKLYKPSWRWKPSGGLFGSEFIRHGRRIIANPLLKALYRFPYGNVGMIVASNKWRNRITRAQMDAVRILMQDRNSRHARMVTRQAKRGNRQAKKIMGIWYRYNKIRKFDPGLNHFPRSDSYIDYSMNFCNIFVFDAIWRAGRHFYNPNGNYPGPRQVYHAKVPGLRAISRSKASKGDIFASRGHVGFVDYRINKHKFKTLEWGNNFKPYVRYFKNWRFRRVV
jgi:hypothetical protein